MKKINIIIFFAVLMSTFGCKHYLEEDLTGKIVGNAALSTQTGLEAALTGSYKGLKNLWSTGFMHSTATAVTMGGDDVTTLPGGNKAELREFDQFDVTAGNSRTANLYSGMYKTIQGANNVIANYQTTKGDATTINTIAGEAYFLRAFSYYWLTRLYGSIPMLTSADFSLDLLTIKRTKPADIYALVEADLKKAEELLPALKRDFGRSNKGAASAFLAEVYLTEAGWPILDASKYTLAAAKAKEVIDNHDTYGFKFLPTYAEIFLNDPTKNGTQEDIFDLTANVADGSSANSNYGWAAMPGDIGGWDDYFSEVGFFNRFPAGPRKDATFRTTYTKSNGTVLTWQQLVAAHPYYGKFWIKGDVANNASSLPFVMMRYTHVLLMYAEAKARTDGPDDDAYSYLNMVRERAGEKPFPVGSLSATAFADSVVQERAWEFAGERTRWFDLVRLQMVEEANAESKKGPGDMRPVGPITKSDYTFPLPLSETTANPNLIQ